MEEELDVKCNCGDNCECGDDCHCGNDCHCGDMMPPLEEKLVLVGIDGDAQTNQAREYLDEMKVDYSFLDLNKKDPMFDNIDFSEVTVPTLLLVHTVISGMAPGMEGIKQVFEG